MEEITTHCFKNIVKLFFICSIVDKVWMEKRESISALKNTIPKNETDKPTQTVP